MKDLDKFFTLAPSIEVDPQHMDVAVSAAIEVFRAKQCRKRLFVPFIASFSGAAAAIAIGCALIFNNQPEARVHFADSPADRADLLRAYSELRETFPEGLAGIAFANGELQIYPGQIGSGVVEPTYLEMLVDNVQVRIIAAQGTTLSVTVDGVEVSIDFMPDVSGLPIVFGENFYWSASEQFMPQGREVLNAERLEAML